MYMNGNTSFMLSLPVIPETSLVHARLSLSISASVDMGAPSRVSSTEMAGLRKDRTGPFGEGGVGVAAEPAPPPSSSAGL